MGVYSTGGAGGARGGVVLSPTSRVLCSYPYDGGAMNYDDGCGPVLCTGSQAYTCAYPPSRLDAMMRVSDASTTAYNEVVVDARHFTIEAVFVISGVEYPRMAQWHQRLLDHYGRTASQLPLLRLEPNRTRDPFRTLASFI